MSDLSTTVQPSEAEDAQADADFAAGAAMETPAKPGEKPRDEGGRFVAAEEKKDGDKDGKPAGEAKPAVEAKPGAEAKPAADAKPEYVQVTKEQLARLTEAADKSVEFEKQFSKVFGTVGDMQKILRGLQAQTPKGVKVTLPPGAFDKLKKDFPEIGNNTEEIFTALIKGIEGTGGTGASIDEDAFAAKVEERVLKMAAEDLADEFPNWKEIVGAVAKGEKPDPNNPFRKWLATKPQDYQDRINGTASSGVLTRAIRIFRSETKAAAAAVAAKPKGAAQTRANRIEEAVRPKGDGGHPPGTNAEDEFEAGFRSG